MTASFDFGFGHYVDGKSWAVLAKDYDLSAGRVWIAILAWVVVGAAIARTWKGPQNLPTEPSLPVGATGLHLAGPGWIYARVTSPKSGRWKPWMARIFDSNLAPD
ncbi:MAG: hypothetical protein M3345_01530 [Actinomycetota bacterium]|nr:hypothetical protein [Actinomycetota bacterium]